MDQYIAYKTSAILENLSYESIFQEVAPNIMSEEFDYDTAAKYLYYFDSKKEKLTQYAEHVWNIFKGTMNKKVEKGIQKIAGLFQIHQ